MYTNNGGGWWPCMPPLPQKPAPPKKDDKDYPKLRALLSRRRSLVLRRYWRIARIGRASHP